MCVVFFGCYFSTFKLAKNDVNENYHFKKSPLVERIEFAEASDCVTTLPLKVCMLRFDSNYS